MKLVTFLFSLTLATSAFAFPKAPFDALKSARPAQFMSNQTGYDFEGIVKLSNCSGAIIKFSGQPTTSKALVLTNGHCYSARGGMLKPGEIAVNVPVKRSMKVFDKQMKLFPITTTKVLYAAMTGTDVTVYELTQTYDELLAKYKVASFDLDTVRPNLGTDIEIVSGYWDRGYSCAIDAFIFSLKEGDYFFNDSLRYTDNCDTVGGTSGSPILAKGTRSVIAINNTANESGGKCGINNPCEISQDGTITVRRNKKYGQQTHDIYSCLTPDFSIDLSIAGCALAKPVIK
jgi:V8-like Glu-specific endopeptidase